MKRGNLTSLFLLLIIIGSIGVMDISRRYLAGDFQTSTIKFEVLYSSEKAGWLETVVEDFEIQWGKDHNQKIDVVITPIGTGKGTIQVANEASKPVIWSPASRFWIPILNLLWEENHDSPIADPESPSLVVSPIVIATWKNYQMKHNISGLQDLHDLAISEIDFSFAHTDPYSSNSGFASVIMEASVAANKEPEELTIIDLQNQDVQTWMRELESRAVQYGSSTGFLGKLMANEGPEKLKVALLYENLVVEKNKELQRKINDGIIPQNQTLVAVYPEEGTVLNDHPFIVLNAPWVDEGEIEIANNFIEYLAKPDILQKAIEFGFRPAIDIEDNLEREVFTPEAGVRTTLQGISIYSIGNMDGKVLDRIPDLWSATRSRALNNEQNAPNQLRSSDYIMPFILGTIFLLMILSPIIQKFRRYY